MKLSFIFLFILSASCLTSVLSILSCSSPSLLVFFLETFIIFFCDSLHQHDDACRRSPCRAVRPRQKLDSPRVRLPLLPTNQ